MTRINVVEENRRIIEGAIRAKRQITALYHRRVRIMCPHAVGVGKDGGRYAALFYQFDGDSERGLGEDGSPENWRCMYVDELFDVAAIDGDGKWHTCERHTRDAPCIDWTKPHVKVET